MTDREAMKLALDALIWTTGSGDFGDGGIAHEGAVKCLFPAITALRKALAEPDMPIDRGVWSDDGNSGMQYPEECDLVGGETDCVEAPPNSTTDVVEPVAKNEGGRITWLVDNWPQNCLLYAEPPSWTPVEIGVDVTPEGTHVVGMYVLMPEAVRYVFYSQFHPTPKREWVGLTVEEVIDAWAISKGDVLRRLEPFARAIEAKLKEKNNG